MVDGDRDGTGGDGDDSDRRLVRLSSGDVAMEMGAWVGTGVEPSGWSTDGTGRDV
jgi:hypothetical protein